MISIKEKTTNEVAEIFFNTLRNDSVPIKMPYEYDDNDLKIVINRYDTGDCCISVITKDINSEYYFGHIIIKKGIIYITEKIEDIDETLNVIPGINPYTILFNKGLTIPNKNITSDKDFKSLLYLLYEVVNYSVNIFKKNPKPQIEDFDFNYNIKKHVMKRIKLNCTENILKFFIPNR